MDNNIHSSSHTIIKLYDKLSYFDQYGGSVFLFLFLTIIVLLANAYCASALNSAEIRKDWINQRCNPGVIPFAGWINKPVDKTAVDFTMENFNYCTQNILTPVTANAISPFSYIVYSIQAIFATIARSIQSIRQLFNYIRDAFAEIMKEIFGRMLNFIIPIQQLVLAAKDTMGKVTGVMTATLYTAQGSYLTLKALLGAIAELAIGFLVAVLVIMVLTFAFLPFLLPVTLSISAFCFAVSIPLMIIVIFLTETMGIRPKSSIPSIPSVPVTSSCFHPSTKVKLANGSISEMQHLNLGDVLENGSVVRAVMKVANFSNESYYIFKNKGVDGEDIYVTGSHLILDDFTGMWIHVKNHVDAQVQKSTEKLQEFSCLITSNHNITVGKMTFWDWEDYLRKGAPPP